MKYVLALSFFYKQYKKDATVRIFADDLLIDELRLDRDIGVKAMISGLTSFRNKFYGTEQTQEAKERIKKQGENWRVYFVPKKMFTYEIDESILNSCIRVECDNQDSNYTNGFMTSWSYIQLEELFLIPKHMLTKAKIKKISKILPEHTDQSLLAKHSVWPNGWSDAEIDKDKSGTIRNVTIGGNFKLKIPLRKKFKTFVFGNPRKPKPFCFDTSLPETITMYKLLNITNENQRSNHP